MTRVSSVIYLSEGGSRSPWLGSVQWYICQRAAVGSHDQGQFSDISVRGWQRPGPKPGSVQCHSIVSRGEPGSCFPKICCVSQVLAPKKLPCDPGYGWLRYVVELYWTAERGNLVIQWHTLKLWLTGDSSLDYILGSWLVRWLRCLDVLLYSIMGSWKVAYIYIFRLYVIQYMGYNG